MTSCYLIECCFDQDFATFGAKVAEHRAHLQTGFDQGWLLLSGPRSDRSGGILIGKAGDPEKLAAFFAADPYCKAGLAHYRISGFEIVKRAGCLDDWLAPA